MNDPNQALEDLESLLAEREPEILALLPDPGRLDRLRREAAVLSRRWPDPAARPPLYGVLAGVKDVFHVSGFPTGAGSRLPPEELAGDEGPAVAALRGAGALILGKTVSTEFAYFAPGATHNPRRPGHTPGGSSSGSAAAVAAGYCPLALGTQTIGSILRPAAYCGIVGYKPSRGRISCEGMIPLAPSLDHVGVLARDVSAAARAAAVLAAGWQRRDPGRRPRLGVPEGPYLTHASEEGMAHFRATCERLAGAGYEIEPVAAFPDFALIAARHRRIVAAEAARVHALWFERHESLYHEKTRDLIRQGQAVTAVELAVDLAACEALRHTLEAQMRERGLDLWISPPAQGAAPEGLESTGDPVMNLPWTQAGLPALALPAGQNDAGLPLGLQVVAHFGEDEALLAWGRELEGALRP